MADVGCRSGAMAAATGAPNFIIDNSTATPRIIYRRNLSPLGWTLGTQVRPGSCFEKGEAMKLDLAELKKQIPTRATLTALQKRLQVKTVLAVTLESGRVAVALMRRDDKGVSVGPLL
jgi:hypothetical protein